MSKTRTLHRMLGIAILSAMFGIGSAHAQAAKDTSSDTTKDAAGLTKENKTGKLSRDDMTMMQQLAAANMAEIQAGKIALEKSQSADVKSFAQKMVDDHTKASDQLQQLAQSKGVTLPTQLDRKHQAEIDKLSKASGDKFDKMYMSGGGVADHRQTHALLNRIQNRAKDQDLKSMATALAPTVDQHWQMAKDMSSGKSTATGSSGSRRSSGAAGAGSSGSSSGSSGTSDTSGNTPGTSGSSSSSGGSGK